MKSGYKALVQDLEGGDTDGLWTWAWGLHVPQKINNFGG